MAGRKNNQNKQALFGALFLELQEKLNSKIIFNVRPSDFL